MKRLLIAFALVLGLALPAAAQEYPMYVGCSGAEAITASAPMFHLEAGTDHDIYVWKVWVVPGTQTTAAYHQVVLQRTTSASTGGSTVTPAPINSSSSVFTGIFRTAATGGGAAGVTILNSSYWVATATTIGQTNPLVLFNALGLTKREAIRILAGGTTGLELLNSTGGAGGANHYACVQFSEEIK